LVIGIFSFNDNIPSKKVGKVRINWRLLGISKNLFGQICLFLGPFGVTIKRVLGFRGGKGPPLGIKIALVFWGVYIGG